jgi:hypothetical protein
MPGERAGFNEAGGTGEPGLADELVGSRLGVPGPKVGAAPDTLTEERRKPEGRKCRSGSAAVGSAGCHQSVSSVR